MNEIRVEALGHTFDIRPGDAYSLGTDGTFAIRWADASIYTYKIIGTDPEDGSYDVMGIAAEDCTASLSEFKDFFSEEEVTQYLEENHPDKDEDSWNDDDGLTDGEADAMTLASCGFW